MSPELISVVVLVAMFVLATMLPVNMGVLGFVAAFLVGTLVVDLTTDEILAGFPADLFLTLVGITYLFGIAQVNGTVDLLVRGSVRAVGGRLAAIPWIMFALTALLVAIGALFAVAIVAPIALRFAFRYRISPLLMGMMVVHGALAGAFSPISVYGSFVNELLDDTTLPSSPLTLFLAPLVFNIVIGVVIFALLGGRDILRATTETVEVRTAVAAGSAGSGSGPGSGPGSDAAPPAADQAADPAGQPVEDPRRRFEQKATLVGLLVFAYLTVVPALDVGFTSMLVAAVLTLMAPTTSKAVVDKVAWSTVLLICGVLTYVEVLQAAGTIEYLSDAVIGLSAPLLGALLICYIGGVASAFASSVAILGVMIPLAIPFLEQGGVGAIGFIAALAIASTVVDVSPFSTNGALVLANAQDVEREPFYRQMLAYSGVVVVLGPLLAWAVLVLPGW